MKRVYDQLSFRKRNIKAEVLMLWNAQLILTCYDPWVRFSALPDDIILLLNEWLKASILGNIRPAVATDDEFYCLSRSTRELRFKSWAEFCLHPYEWLQEIDRHGSPFTSTYREPGSDRVAHRVARFLILNTDKSAFKRLRNAIETACETYENFSNRLKIIVERSVSWEPTLPVTDLNYPSRAQVDTTTIYIMIAPAICGSPWAWKKQRKLSHLYLVLCRNAHENADRIARDVYDIVKRCKH
jgi:hypothetical protein